MSKSVTSSSFSSLMAGCVRGWCWLGFSFGGLSRGHFPSLVFISPLDLNFTKFYDHE